jgi:hypothetical protein
MLGQFLDNVVVDRAGGEGGADLLVPAAHGIPRAATVRRT